MGYAAKVVAAAVFVSGRSLESVYEQEFSPAGFLERAFRCLLSIDVDRDERTVTARVLGVERTAVFREGYGCTLAIGRTVDELRGEVGGAAETRSQAEPREGALRDSFDDDREYWEFPRRELFDPIGMTSAVFELDASGTLVGSSCCHATARDWARFGQLYLDDGVANGKRILPEGWVAGASEPTRGSKRRYGRHFWLPRDKTLPSGTFLCPGFEGQLLAIVPAKRAVIVRLGSTRDRKAWDPDAFVASVPKALH